MAKKAPSKKAAKKAAVLVPQFRGEAAARAAAEYADDKKAEDIVIMDLRGISPITDYLVTCNATSMPHLRAVRDEIEGKFREDHDLRPLVRDGSMESLWLILHYADVTVHIFHKEKRDFYSLEELWSDAPRVPWEPAVPPAMKKAPVRKEAKKAPAKKVAAKKAPAKKATKKAAKK